MSLADETKTEVWLALRADGAANIPSTPTSGTAADPYDASSPTLFADRMNSFQKNTKIIHLGPGVFQTFGYVSTGLPVPNSWQPVSGQKIIGAGMFATTLKVVGATNQSHLTCAICNDPLYSDPPFHGQFLDGFEASDFTVDCNMRGHIGARVAIGAVSVLGRRIRLRRIRAIDYGTEAKNPPPLLECFVITAGGGHPSLPESSDCTMEDCLIEKPYRNGRYNNTCALIGGGGESGEGYTGYSRSCVARNCLINNEYQDNPVAISSITCAGTPPLGCGYRYDKNAARPIHGQLGGDHRRAGRRFGRYSVQRRLPG